MRKLNKLYKKDNDKIYCDTADIKTIKKCIKVYNVDGVTTNPSIMRANGVKNYKSQCLKI